MKSIFLFSQAILATARTLDRRSTECTQVSVNTTSGLFAPYISTTHPDVASFLDIPYAQNPTGPLRFAPPVRAKPHDNGVIHATTLPAGCFQYIPPFIKGTIGLQDPKAGLFQRGDYANTTEDCLRLTIFAPKSALPSPKLSSKPLLPVVVWLHGGGYSFGGTNVPFQLAPSWVQRSQAHIVVQVQYRLNLLGLPNAAGLAAQDKNFNIALLDQRAAMEWVRDNIAALGGDPERITLWGESAGGYAVDGYLFSWAEDPIVKGVVASSGLALAIEGGNVDGANHTVFGKAADRLGCGGLEAEDELACMRALPEEQIKEYVQGGGATQDGSVFGTVVDNVTAFTDYEGRIEKRQFAASVPVLLGTNEDEGTAVVPSEFPGSEAATELPPELAPIARGFKLNLQCKTIQETRLRMSAGSTTYQYLYAGNFSDVSPRPWLGAYHSAELPMVFGTYGNEGPATDFEKTVSERMQDMYLAFIQDPVNGLKKKGWSPATGQQGSRVATWAANGNIEELKEVNKLRDECVRNGFPV